jgi:hypothetical protein
MIEILSQAEFDLELLVNEMIWMLDLSRETAKITRDIEGDLTLNEIVRKMNATTQIHLLMNTLQAMLLDSRGI